MLILKVAICDDDEVYRKDILHHLFEFMFKTDIELNISEYESGDALLGNYHSKGDFDLLFLDVEIPIVAISLILKSLSTFTYLSAYA